MLQYDVYLSLSLSLSISLSLSLSLLTTLLIVSQYMQAASTGKGIDRHFLGLALCLQDGEEAPPLFRDAVFSRSRTWKLTTSNMSPSRHFSGGFGPVVPHGYGACYIIQDNRYVYGVGGRLCAVR